MSGTVDKNSVTAMEENEKFESIKTVRPRYAMFDKGLSSRGERSSIKLLNPSSSKGLTSYEKLKGGMTDFFLQRISVRYSEKSQIVQTFGGADVVYYFGQTPMTFQLNGLLFDDIDNGWFIDFAKMYHETLRGTKLAQNQQLLQIDTPSMTILGTIAEFSHDQEASRDTDIPFSITIIAQRVSYKAFSKDGKVGLASTDVLPTITLPPINAPTRTQAEIEALKANETLSEGLSHYDENGIYLGTSTNYSNVFSTSISGLSSTEKSISAYAADFINDLNRIISPTEQVLGAVRDLSGAAVSLVKTVEASTQRIINVPMRLITNIDRTHSLFKDSIGVIAYVPESISDKISRFVKDGVIDNSSPILNGAKSSEETAAILSTRDHRTGESSATILSRSDAYATLGEDTGAIL